MNRTIENICLYLNNIINAANISDDPIGVVDDITEPITDADDSDV